MRRPAARLVHNRFAMDLGNLYFTCGADMDLATLEARSGGGGVVSIARLPGYRLGFFGHNPVWDSGIETLVADDGSEVWGVLYRLGSIEWDRLDASVGATIDGLGSHFHYPVEVEPPAGERCMARTYRKAVRGPAQPPSREYLDFLVDQAVARGLPGKYVDALRAIPTLRARYTVPKPDGLKRRHLHLL